MPHPGRVSYSDFFPHGKYKQEKRRDEREFVGGTSYHHINKTLTAVTSVMRKEINRCMVGVIHLINCIFRTIDSTETLLVV